jgi:hypothetical protein
MIPAKSTYIPGVEVHGIGQDVTTTDAVAAARARGLVWGFLLGAGLMGLMAWASMGAMRR